MSTFVHINETIEVAGFYKKKQRFRPTAFRWRNHKFAISEITLHCHTKDGGVPKRWYSVMAENTLYRLEFTVPTEEWQLLEIWEE